MSGLGAVGSVRPGILLVILGMAAVTYLPRVVPLAVLSRFALPPPVLRWLSFVPVAVLSALLAQEVLVAGGKPALPPAHLEPVALLPPIVVALRTRSLMGTVIAGTAAMALLRLVFHA